MLCAHCGHKVEVHFKHFSFHQSEFFDEIPCLDCIEEGAEFPCEDFDH